MKIRSVLVVGVAMLAGVLIGRSCARNPDDAQTPDSATSSAPAAKQVWTCSMHPQIRLDSPATARSARCR